MARRLRRTTALASLVLVPGLLLAACGSDDGSSGSASASGSASGSGSGSAATSDAPETVSEGTLTVCSDTPYDPFEMDGGKGYDMDLLRAIGEAGGLEMEIKDLPFEGILGSLAAGDCDVVGSALTITDERKEQVDFSDPYFDADQSLLVKADQAGELKDLASLAGKTIGVQSTTTGEAYANEHKPEGATIKAFEDADGLFSAIEAGEIDAILQDLPVNAYRTTQDDSLEVVETYPTGEQYGFAVEKGNEAILNFVNDGLAALRDSGEFDEIYATYFGDTAE